MSVESGSFDRLAEPIMEKLREERTHENRKELLELFLPIWDYYIRYYLYKHGLNDQHANIHDMYSDLYCNCVDLLQKVKTRPETNFNRIKRYYNKSIAGWTYNLLYKKKRLPTIVNMDDVDIELFPDRVRPDRELEYILDSEKLEKVAEEQSIEYVDLFSFLIGKDALKKHKERHQRSYREKVFASYMHDGSIPPAMRMFDKRIGALLIGRNTE